MVLVCYILCFFSLLPYFPTVYNIHSTLPFSSCLFPHLNFNFENLTIFLRLRLIFSIKYKATEGIKNEAIYNSIPSQLANPSNKFQFSKINNNARKRDYEISLDWLLSSKMIIKSNAIKKVEIPLKGFIDEDVFKLYLSDVGILTSLLELKYEDIMLNKEFMYKGVLAESYVATELIRKQNLYYWQSENRSEIDFLLYNKKGIIPIEVKANINNNSKSLNYYMEKYKPAYAIRISSRNFGFENNIKSVPLYATFCINYFDVD